MVLVIVIGRGRTVIVGTRVYAGSVAVSIAVDVVFVTVVDVLLTIGVLTTVAWKMLSASIAFRCHMKVLQSQSE